MARSVKNKLLAARADGVLIEQVSQYIDAAGLTMGELVRTATIEYMKNHPVTPVQLTKTTTTRSLV